MPTSLARSLRAAALTASTALTAACSTLSPQPAAPPTIPLPPAELMQSVQPDISDYSQRLQDWLSKAANELRTSQPRSQGCKTTREPSAGQPAVQPGQQPKCL